MAISLRHLCVAILVAGVALVIGVWRSLIVNPLHFYPVSLKGKTAVVTGATEGIGKETAKVLASWGADLILPVRNAKKGQLLKQEIEKEAAPGVKISILDGVDFSDFQTIRDFAKKILNEKVDILVNNAGMSSLTLENTKDDIDIMYQVNHLSPFLITYLLIPNLKKASSGARVVFVSSFNHYNGDVGTYKYSEIQRGKQELRRLARYDDTKLMNVMTAASFADEFGKNTKITFNSVHPGFVISNIDSNLPPGIGNAVLALRHIAGRNTREGAMAQVTLATHPKLEGVSGRYFSDSCMNELCNVTCLWCDTQNPPGVRPNKEATNKTARDWLWNVSKKLTGVA